MTSSIEEYIKDSFDDIMKDYLESDTYKQERWEINQEFMDFRSELKPEHRERLNSLLNTVDNSNNLFALEAFYLGVINGIALNEQVLGSHKKN